MNVARARASSGFRGLALVSWLTFGTVAPGCGDGTVVVEGTPDGGTDGGSGLVVETLKPSADPLPGETECTVVRTTGIPVGAADHLPYCTKVAYATNPPSGGDHWQQWAAFKEYSTAIPREIYVHDMEHGAVVLAYKCADACPEVVQMLRDVVAEATSDPLCLEFAGNAAARFVITPDPELDTPIAAAAWGATYTATCIDKASLAKFAADVYGTGPEATCYPGKDPTDPSSGIPTCDGSAGN